MLGVAGSLHASSAPGSTAAVQPTLGEDGAGGGEDGLGEVGGSHRTMLSGSNACPLGGDQAS